MRCVVDQLATLKAGQTKLTDEQEFAGLIAEAEAIAANADAVLASFEAQELAVA